MPVKCQPFFNMKLGQKKNPNRTRNIYKLGNSWIVDIQAAGKRTRKFFQNKKDAVAFLDNYKFARRLDLAYFVSLTGDQIKDIKDAIAKLPTGKTLLQSVEKAWLFYSESNLHEIVDSFFDIKKTKHNVGKISNDEFRHIKGRVENFKKTFATFSDVTPPALLEYLRKKGSNKTISHWRGTISEILELAVARGAISTNPMKLLHDDELIVSTDKTSFTGSISVETARALMNFIETKYPQYSKFFSIGLFCGIRVAEIPRLKEEYFRYDERKIVFPAQIGKVKKAWVLENLPENLWAWLDKYKGVAIQTPTPKERTSIGELFNLPQNFARHSFTTYHLSLYFDLAKTSKITRNGEQILKDRYFDQLVDKETAQAYFDILPSGQVATAGAEGEV